LTNSARLTHRDDLVADVERRLATLTRDEVVGELEQLSLPCGRIRDVREVYECDQTRAQGLLAEVSHPFLGNLTPPGSPLRFGDESFAGPRAEHVAPPLLDQDRESILSWLAEPAVGP
jgi:crotonobetainyl-CoA:carnitine CoA-transferase CaiB-like acyl-CoA transferase